MVLMSEVSGSRKSMGRRSRIVIAVMAASFVGLTVAAGATARASSAFFIDSNSAGLTLEESLWAQRNHVANVECHGYGRYRSGVLGPEFASFSCAAYDRGFNRLGVVSAVTVGPEWLRVVKTLSGRFVADPGVGAVVSRGRFYLDSNEAGLIIGDSAWAQRNRVENVNCHGVGSFRSGIIGAEFSSFVCALYGTGFNRLGLVFARTDGPESVVPVKILR
jgi:hypothetical protein